MLDRTSPLILYAAPAGLALGLAAWLVFARSGAAENLAVLQTRLNAVPKMGDGSMVNGDFGIAQAISAPLFALTTGPGAVAEVSLQLQGLARTPRRRAALLSINGAPAEWFEVGVGKAGVTLQDAAGSMALVDTPLGLREVKLGEEVSAAPAGVGGGDEIPPGVRLPPEPASAPDMAR